MTEYKGRIKENDIDAVRERNNLVDVVSEYVALKKKGKLFWGLCPYHQEKTPSFKVDAASQLFHCFGCGEGGNVFNFIMKVEHLEFPEAVEFLAARAGYQLEYEAGKSRELSKRERLYEANSQAMLFYQHILLKTAEGEPGRMYLKKRGLGADIVKGYGIGLAPQEWSALGNYLAKRKFSKEELVEAGLIVKSAKGHYDRFRSRLIFPITDTRGRTIAFGGRVLDSGQPKYMNSPETPTYHKSSTLYGLHLAKNDITKEGFVVVVEGYTDVLALAQAGVPNVVATLGTAFTGEHVELLKRFANRAILVFDADAAGTKAAESASAYMSDFRPPMMKALREFEGRGAESGLDVRVVVLPNHLDPADYIANHSVESLRELLDDAEPFYDFYLTRELEKYTISETQEKEKAALAGLKFIATLDPITHEEYIGKVAQKLGLDARVLSVRFRSLHSKTTPRRGTAIKTSLDPQEKTERTFLHLIMKYPRLREGMPAGIEGDYFVSPAHAKLLAVLKGLGAGKFDTKTLDDLDNNLKAKATEVYLTEAEYEEENLAKYFEDISLSLKDFYYKRQISKLKRELESPTAQRDSTRYDALFGELIELEAKRRDLR